MQKRMTNDRIFTGILMKSVQPKREKTMKKRIKVIAISACTLVMAMVFCIVFYYSKKAPDRSLLSTHDGEIIASGEKGPLSVSFKLVPVRKSNLLTIAQTIGTVYVESIDTSLFNLYRHANPKSKKYLYRILADKNQIQYHHSVWRILGYIGDGADVKLLEKTVNTYSGLLDDNEQDNLIAMFDCLGLMCARDIKEASTLVDKMQNIKYWKNAGFKLSSNPTLRSHEFEYDMIFLLMAGYSLSGSSDLSERSQQIVKGIQNPDEKSGMQGATNPALLLSHGANTRKTENDPISTMERIEVAKLFNGDLQNPRPAKLITGSENDSHIQVNQPENSVNTKKNTSKIIVETQDDLGKKVSENLFKESIIAFEVIRSATLARKYETVLDAVLDDGEIVDKLKVQRRLKEYKNGLQIEYRIFQLSKELETKYETPTVQRSREIDENGKVLKEVVTVFFKWTGTSGITPKVFPREVNRRTFMEDGTLVILMKRIDSKWYWNPFAW